MRPFTIVPHTSEIGIEVRGRDLKTLFHNAALGLLSVFDKRGKVKAKEQITVRVRSSSAESLLVHWLSELVYIVQTHRWVFAKIEFSKVSESSLTATLHGEPLREGAHQLGREVKAVTFHRLSISREHDALKANVILDV